MNIRPDDENFTLDIRLYKKEVHVKFVEKCAIVKLDMYTIVNVNKEKCI